MASRPSGYGMTAELAAKRDASYDTSLEAKAREWIEAVTGDQLTPAELGADNFHQALKSGTTLVKLANALNGGKIKANESKMAFKQMENIGNFLTAMGGYGVPSYELFQTVDLYEATNMGQVVIALHAIGRKAQKSGFSGPAIKS